MTLGPMVDAAGPRLRHTHTRGCLNPRGSRLVEEAVGEAVGVLQWS